MFNFNTKVDLEEQRRVRARASNLKPAYIGLIPRLIPELVQSFPTQGASIGAPWAPLRQSWARRKGNSKILWWTGELEQQFTKGLQVQVDKVRFFVVLPRKEIRRLAPAIVGNDKGDIPPREIFGWNQKMARIVADALIAYVADGKY